MTWAEKQSFRAGEVAGLMLEDAASLIETNPAADQKSEPTDFVSTHVGDVSGGAIFIKHHDLI
jgi:hypothetical protein